MIDARLNEKFLHSAICGMIDAVRTNQGFEITLPQIYHTGHSAVVVVSEVPEGFLVHDNSYAAMLVSQFGQNISEGAYKSIKKAIDAYGCEIDGLKVFRKCVGADEIALSTVLVGCASRLIADHLLDTPAAPAFDFRTKVVTRVSEVVGARRVRTNEEVSGHLGAKYHITAVVLDQQQSKPIAFLEPVASKDSIARKFKEFYDLSKTEVYHGIERVAVLNDDKPLSSPDVLLLQEVSNPVRFSDTPSRFAAWETTQ